MADPSTTLSLCLNLLTLASSTYFCGDYIYLSVGAGKGLQAVCVLGVWFLIQVLRVLNERACGRLR